MKDPDSTEEQPEPTLSEPQQHRSMDEGRAPGMKRLVLVGEEWQPWAPKASSSE